MENFCFKKFLIFIQTKQMQFFIKKKRRNLMIRLFVFSFSADFSILNYQLESAVQRNQMKVDSQQFPMKRESIIQSFNTGKIDMFQSNTSNETMAGRHLCIMCLKTFMTSGGLYKHKKIAHGRTEDLIPCPECDNKFVTQSALKRHISKHSTDRPFICQICGKSYKTKYALNSHPCR